MIGQNVQLPRLDRQDSMFRDGRTFQPASNSGLGPVRLHIAGGALNRPQHDAQQIPTVEMGQAVPPPKIEPPPTGVPPTISDQDVNRHPAMRGAWGRLKKKDAAELAQALAEVISRMRAKGIPPGMVAQIQARPGKFAATAAATRQLQSHED